jgi:ABC-type lipoprotein export system ATPase subunit
MSQLNQSKAYHKLEALELTKVFPHPAKEKTNIPLFAGSSFEMDNQAPNFLLGASGSGKTTFLRMIMGLEPVTAGELIYDKLAIHRLEYNDRISYLQTVGYLNQFPARYLEMHLTVQENLDYSLILHYVKSSKERKEKIRTIAEFFDLSTVLDHQSITLSGGELRRLGLACSIIFDPILLLCDEPTGQLDRKNKQRVLKNILDLSKQKNTLIIIATHDRSLVGDYPVYQIENRRIIRCQ